MRRRDRNTRRDKRRDPTGEGETHKEDKNLRYGCEDHYRERRSERNTSEGRRRRDGGGGEEGREGTGGRKRDTREGEGRAPVGPRGRGNEGGRKKPRSE